MDERKQKTQAYFDEVNERYTDFYRPDAPLTIFPSGPMREEKARRLVQQYKPVGSRVLDTGCGTGHFACQLAQLGYQATGIDISEGMVEQSQKTAQSHGLADKVLFDTGDTEHLDFQSESFDAVTSLGVIEYLTTDAAMLSEVRRVLKPGGVAVIAFRNRLFNLFSQNQYTSREIEAGEMSALLADYQAEAASVRPEDLKTYAQVLVEQARLAADEEAVPAPVGAAVGKAIPIELRQHTPRSAREACAAHGLVCKSLLYFHFHPFPPGFEKSHPRLYNRLAVAMEALTETSVGALMASAFVGAFVAE
ncbi:MAG: class I SAM-dependent methyltransferase [Phycisphaerae bacterium]